MIFQPEYAVPIRDVVVIVGVSLGPLGLVIVWFARLGIVLKQGIERALLLIEDKEVGLLVTARRNNVQVQAAMGELSNQLVAVAERVSRVETRCDMIHPQE